MLWVCEVKELIRDPVFKHKKEANFKKEVCQDYTRKHYVQRKTLVQIPLPLLFLPVNGFALYCIANERILTSHHRLYMSGLLPQSGEVLLRIGWNKHRKLVGSSPPS